MKSNPQDNCCHEKFTVKADIGRITEEEGSDNIIGFGASIQINCAVCGQPFEFIGLPTGYHEYRPTTNLDATELRAPIRVARQFLAKKTNQN